MTSKIKVDTIENVAGSGNVSLGSGHNLVVPGNITGQGTAAITSNATVGGTLGVTGNTTMGGTAAITGNSTVGGTLGVTGKITSTAGITFGSDTAAANVLDDYEEGNWTPTADQGLSSFTITSAKYAKVGRFVFAQCFLSSLSGKDSNQVKIGGLPFNVESNAYNSCIFESGSSGDFGLGRGQPDAAVVHLFKFNNSSHHRENFDGNSLGSHLIFGLGYVTAS